MYRGGIKQTRSGVTQSKKGLIKYGQPDPEINPYNYIIHKVKSGETLEGLAKEYDVSTQDIIDANKAT